jgi:hypothetical protein
MSDCFQVLSLHVLGMFGHEMRFSVDMGLVTRITHQTYTESCMTCAPQCNVHQLHIQVSLNQVDSHWIRIRFGNVCVWAFSVDIKHSLANNANS